MTEYAIYGCEGFAREALLFLRKRLADKGVYSGPNQIVFVDDDARKIGHSVHGHDVVSFDDILTESHRHRCINVCIADPLNRKRLVQKCEDSGIDFFSINEATCHRSDNVTCGEGAVFGAHTTVTGDTVVGTHFHCNIYSYVAHDCRIGDFVTFAPRVSCNGRVHIDDLAYVGTGAVIRQGKADKPLQIGRGAVVGMGSVVLQDVPPGAVVAGNPARIIRMTGGIC